MSFSPHKLAFLLALSLVFSAPDRCMAQAEESPSNSKNSDAPIITTLKRADALVKDAKAQEAVDLLTRLLADNSSMSDDRVLMLLSRAHALVALKKNDDALRDLEEIINSSVPTHSAKVTALLRTIGVHSIQLNYKSLIAETTQVLEVADEKELFTNGTSRGFVLGTRAFAYLYLREPAKALADCNEALSDAHLRRSQEGFVYHTRALIYLALRKLPEAANDFQHALDNPETQPDIRASSRKFLDAIRQRQTTRPVTQPTTKE